MESEQERRHRRRLEAVAQDVTSSLPDDDTDILPEALPTNVEDLLWDYAMGLLEPPEEKRVFRLLACSERAEQALSHIRQSMAETGMANPIEVSEESELAIVVERVVAGVTKRLESVGRDVASVAALIVKMPGGLVSAFEPGTSERRVFATAPSYFAGAKLGDPSEEAEAVRTRIDVPDPAGFNVAVICRATGQVDLQVEVSTPPQEGEVRLLQVVIDQGKEKEVDTYITVRLRNGVATLEDCPEGELKIVVPGDREKRIYLQGAES